MEYGADFIDVEAFQDVPDVRVVYISETDVLHGRKTMYHLDHVFRENGMAVDNGLEMIFVNAQVDDGSEVAELMTDAMNMA